MTAQQRSDPKSGISRADWLKALGEVAHEPDPDALTIRELMGMFGICRDATRDRVRVLVSEGKAVRVFKTITDASGRRQRVPCYRLKKGK